MTEDPIYPLKLPGHRRGLINGASAWMASDHILLVTSRRFREEYKRYYLRDIQAIAIARTTNYHISSRGWFFVLVWLIAMGMSFSISSMAPWVWISAVVVAAVWVYISADRSCVCRIYTAVSSDLLPSVYRTWTARRCGAGGCSPASSACQAYASPPRTWLSSGKGQASSCSRRPRSPVWVCSAR